MSKPDVGFRTWFRNRLEREDAETLNGRVRRALAGWEASPPTGTSAGFFTDLLGELDAHLGKSKPNPKAAPPSDADAFA